MSKSRSFGDITGKQFVLQEIKDKLFGPIWENINSVKRCIIEDNSVMNGNSRERFTYNGEVFWPAICNETVPSWGMITLDESLHGRMDAYLSFREATRTEQSKFAASIIALLTKARNKDEVLFLLPEKLGNIFPLLVSSDGIPECRLQEITRIKNEFGFLDGEVDKLLLAGILL